MRQDRGGAADAKDRDEGGSHPATREAAETANIDTTGQKWEGDKVQRDRATSNPGSSSGGGDAEAAESRLSQRSTKP